MFQSKTAWFSTSVGRECQNYWASEAGTTADWRTADYLFSEDAANPDTLRIYESKDYLSNKVTVFHGMFLSACEKRHSVKSVCIGHYVLPPACVLDEVRHVVGRFIWEQEDDQFIAQGSLSWEKGSPKRSNDPRKVRDRSRDSEQSDSDALENREKTCEQKKDPVNNMVTGYISIDNLRKYRGVLCDIQPERVCKRKSVELHHHTS